MARVRMVTRTIVATEVEVMAMNVTTASVTIDTYTLTGEDYTEETALKVLQKMLDTDTYKVVVVQKLTKREELYGMTELEFLEVAKKLDPTTRKMLDEETEN